MDSLISYYDQQKVRNTTLYSPVGGSRTGQRPYCQRCRQAFPHPVIAGGVEANCGGWPTTTLGDTSGGRSCSSSG
jgi:hypothetical protein